MVDLVQGVTNLLNNIGINTPGNVAPPGSVSSGQFPSNLSARYYCALEFFKYSRADMNKIGTATRQHIWKVPIPVNLVDAQGVSFGEEALGTALGGAGSALMGHDPNAASSKIGEAGKALGIGGAAGALDALGLANIASAAFGITANPFLTVLFKSPNYRTYSMSWRFYPRNQQESQSLFSLSQTLRWHQLPERQAIGGGAVLGYPSLIKPTLVAGGGQLYPFKYGVIENSSINYAPDGVPSFHNNGRPTAVEISISVKEVEYFLKNSFGGSN